MEKEKKKPKVLTVDEVYNRYEHYLTVGMLKEKIKDLPDDTKIVAERVEDVYFEEHNWGVLEVPNDLYPDFMDQYHPVWCSWTYRDDKRILFLALHY